jgi:hypothetical protein
VINIIRALLHGYFGIENEPTVLEPFEPGELAAAVTDPKARHRVVEGDLGIPPRRH